MSSLRKTTLQSTLPLDCRILDYRNGKYQGQVQTGRLVREGMGILLDHNYLCAIGMWKKGNLYGQMAIVYPDNSIFYGSLSDLTLSGVSCYQISSYCYLYSCVNTQADDLFIMDIPQAHSLELLTVNRKVMDKLVALPTISSNYEITLYAINLGCGGGLVKLEGEIKYANEEEKWIVLAKFFRMQTIPDYIKSLRYFLEKRIKYQPADIRMTKSKDNLSVAFPGTSITLRLHYLYNLYACILRSISFHDNEMNIDELQKKVNEKRDEIEEIVVLRVCQLQRYRNIPHERPMAAINNLHSYYRQSLNFVNDFIEVDYLYRIKHIFYCIEQYINRYAISRYAQVQVPLTYKQQQHQQSFGTEIHRRNSDSQWDSIEKVKEDIHRAVSRKGGSITGSPSRKVKINFNEWHYDKRSTNKLDIRVKYSDKKADINARQKSNLRRTYSYIDRMGLKKHQKSLQERFYANRTGEYKGSAQRKLSPENKELISQNHQIYSEYEQLPLERVDDSLMKLAEDYKVIKTKLNRGTPPRENPKSRKRDNSTKKKAKKLYKMDYWQISRVNMGKNNYYFSRLSETPNRVYRFVQ